MSAPGSILALNTIAFAACFAMWVLFGVTAIPIASELKLDPAQTGLLTATPIFLGAVLRVPVGALTNRFGARVMFPVLMAAGAACAYAASCAHSFAEYLLAGLALGLVGSSFAVGVFAVSAWFPPERRGGALGVFGVGNLGTAVTAFGAPYLVSWYGVPGTFRIYAGVLAAGAVAYALAMRDAPGATGQAVPMSRALVPLREARTWRFGLYYLVTFGGFLALSLSLPQLYRGVYALPVTRAGAITAGFGLISSLIRAPGGWFSDRFGPRATLRVCAGAIAVISTVLALAPLPLALHVALAYLAAVAMGIGSAACFKYVAEYYPYDVGTVGGLVGAIGGLGGFILPPLSGRIIQATGSAQSGPLALAVLATVALIVQRVVVRGLEEADRRVVEAQAGAPDLGVFSVEASDVDGARVLAVHGRLDESAAPAIADVARRELTAGHRRLVLELGGCALIASAGLNAIIVIQRECVKLGARLELANPRPAVADVLKMTGLLKLVPGS